jgi:site-specific DNA-methyltransferase (adenine-specific)
MNQIVQAFAACHDGYAVDRVIADPELNNRFISACRDLGCNETATELNRKLINLRKQGRLSELKARRKTSFPDEDAYRFASEIAARFMERQLGISLDLILCDPELARQFDEMAQRISPGFTSLQYRYAALNLRKVKKLQPELVSRVASRPLLVQSWPMNDFDIELVPVNQGLYLLYDSNELLYVGESDNLRSRLKKHLDHSDNKGFARWLWDTGSDALNIEVHVLKADTPARTRKALELELIRSRSPVFNIKR